MTTPISSKGRITVPVEIREALGLEPGTCIDILLGPSGTFLATKAKETSFFAKFKSVSGKRKLPYGNGHKMHKRHRMHRSPCSLASPSRSTLRIRSR